MQSVTQSPDKQREPNGAQHAGTMRGEAGLETGHPMHHRVTFRGNFLDVQIWCPLRFYVEFYSWRNIGDTSVAVVTIPFYRVSNEM